MILLFVTLIFSSISSILISFDHQEYLVGRIELCGNVGAGFAEEKKHVFKLPILNWRIHPKRQESIYVNWLMK